MTFLETMHIVAVSNDLYAKHTAVMLHSILENKNSDHHIKLYIIGNISNENQQRINRVTQKFGVTVQFYSVSNSIFKGFKLYGYFKKEAYYRILIPDLLDDDIEKAIYLDSDIVVKDDITKLWNMNIDNYYLAAVQATGKCAHKIRKKILGIPIDYKYFNSGVMVLNLKKWRKGNISSKVIEFARKNPAKLRFIDQDSLNAILYNNWLELSPIWNYTTLFIKTNPQKDPSIIHFTGKSKPWSSYHPLKKEYIKYEKKIRWSI